MSWTWSSLQCQAICRQSWIRFLQSFSSYWWLDLTQYQTSCSVDLSGAESRIFRTSQVKPTPHDGLAGCVAKASAAETLRPRLNGCHFADDSLKLIFLNENVWILIKISLKFIPNGPIKNIPALVQMMVWCRPGDKSLSELMMVRLLMHIFVSQPQWVNCV